ncbi:hypothetical protein SZN_32271 [Streptomyces zinciresistens K42]|uniref:Uncharacterized protein n=1 Tax=Streptomyces zinciresistens K42 TaxID=700597 RepID=G2GLQ2_9ACTN|nr:hypothetical protein [Streptomyces zinciresistens]EGX55560.1 hypothetical protein SZN_32271 [Streptomyces zinciresistens K42]
MAAAAVALPLAWAAAGQVAEAGRTAVQAPARGTGERPAGESAADPSPRADAKGPSAAPADSPLTLDLGLATAVRCGPELTSPGGIEAQTCVLTQGEQTWARTYFRNATGAAVDSVLSLMGPAGRTLQMRCAVGADDEPGTCETPRARTRGASDAYTAVTEFAERTGGRALLLRSASNSVPGKSAANTGS